jgi:hypothetical protein
MAPTYLFSTQEVGVLEKHGVRWVGAATSINRHIIADEVSGKIADARETALSTPLSPRERQELFEVGSA